MKFRSAMTGVVGIVLLALPVSTRAEDTLSVETLLGEFKKATAACKLSDDIDSDVCNQTYAIERVLEDRGACRGPNGDDQFYSCANYRNYQVLPQMKGYNFGFRWLNGRQFSTRFSSYEAARGGDIELRDIGTMVIHCGDEGASVTFEIDAHYPDFPDEGDGSYVVGMVDGEENRQFVSGFFEKPYGRGTFGFMDEGAAPRILTYLRDSLEVGMPGEDLKVVFWPANKNNRNKTLELEIGGVVAGNAELTWFKPEIQALLTEMIEICAPA